ncbi:hypothetical protein EJ03DRAFT_266480 [Teratosphaeria nubilosa]|uniref:Cleavage and polyadenylation specificity factor subunit 2 n=1 Tax=Teratosphaeria nubilosa TaxID=161662 RepID=A0A6G1LHW1_9PEZI|nr:hypothetical protein EJ03DRAFT_266480 [Teratosphaeria nubilosa]
MFTFTPLLGAQSASRASQSLLELDGGVKVLVDVGWDEAFEVEKLQALEAQVPTLSVILLTHPTLSHVGAYAHCCKHIPLFSKIPVYATTPVINLGRTLLADVYASSPLAASVIPTSTISSPHTATQSDASPNILLDVPTFEEIGTYFAHINALKYSQPHQPNLATWAPATGSLTVTAYSAGHSLGGTVWHLQQGMESIVYAADFNQGRESLLPGTSILLGGSDINEPLRRPTALVCSSKGVERSPVLRGASRDEALFSVIRDTISQGGKVLIPTDSSGRVLELAFNLNQMWAENVKGPHADTFKQARIYLASKSSEASIRYLQSMVEWVNDKVRNETETALVAKAGERSNPLEWQHITLIERARRLERPLKRKRPCVILASDESLEWGYSRQALQELADDPRNLVIMTEDATISSSSASGAARQLWGAWQSRQGQASTLGGAKVVNTDGLTIELRQPNAEALNENETTLYETYVARQRQLHSTLQGDNTDVDPAGATVDEQDEESESEDEDEDGQMQGRSLNTTAAVTLTNKRKVGLSDAELGVNILLRGKGVYDYDVRHSNRGRDKTFPFLTHRSREDDYGEVIKAEDYMRAEERDEVDGIDMRDGAQKKHESSVGQKRKWDDAAPVLDARGPTGQSLTAPNTNGDLDESSETDDSDEEVEDTTKGPQKVVFTTQPLTLRLKLAHVDYSGLHEKRDLSMIIPLMRPRKLILISGSVSETRSLSEACQEAFSRQNYTPPTIFTPMIGETVDASVDTNAWTLKLSRELVKNFTTHMKEARKGMEIVAITGRLLAEVEEEEESETKQIATDPSEPERPASKNPKLDSITPSPPTPNTTAPKTPLLDLLPPSTSTTTTTTTQKPTPTVHVGDLRLSALRDVLTRQNYHVAFVGEGTLLVNGLVIVRKSSAGGRIDVEAVMGGLQAPGIQVGWRAAAGKGSFYEAKEAIYRGLAVVAGV